MADGRLLGARCHPQGPQETVHQDIKLVHILRLSLHHVENYLVPLPHALCMRRANIILDNGFPFSSAQPAPHEALNLKRDQAEKESKKKTTLLIKTSLL